MPNAQTNHEPSKAVKQSKEVKKVDHSDKLREVQAMFKSLGELSIKLKGCGTAEAKKQVTDKHRYDLNEVRKKIKVLKTVLIESNDGETYKKLLTWERQRDLIGVQDRYKLNAMEYEELKVDNCECYNPTPSGVKASLGEKYRYFNYFDEATQKEMYVTYIPVTIDPESQIPRELEWQISRGYMPKMEEYPPAKILIDRRVLVEREWIRYFREI